MTEDEINARLADYDRQIAKAAGNPQKQLEIGKERYHFQSYVSIEYAKSIAPPAVDDTLPLDDVDPEREWCFPGHAHTHHCMEQVIAARAKADKHPDPKEAAKLRIAADALEKKAHKRVLSRQHHYVDWRGQRRLLYVLWHRGGHQTDVWHTHDKKQWSEQDAKDFHAERVAHPGWTEPKPTLHEFEKRARVKHITPPLISGGNQWR